MRLTKETMASFRCEPGKEDTFWDERLPGYGLRARPTGAKTLYVQYAFGGRTRKIFLGSPDVVPAGQAYEKAKDLLAKVRLGGDPAGEKAAQRVKAAETIGALLPRFLDRQRARLKPRSFEETERHLMKHARPLHGHAVEAVSSNRRIIATRLAEIEKESGRRRPITCAHR